MTRSLRRYPAEIGLSVTSASLQLTALLLQKHIRNEDGIDVQFQNDSQRGVLGQMMLDIARKHAATLFLAICIFPASLCGQSEPSDATVHLNRVTSFTALPDGIDLRDGEARMEIVALRQDVLRVRISRSPEFAEDASWAVLQEPRRSRTAVKPSATTDAVGFQTEALVVSINRQTFNLTVSNLAGSILQQDARPVDFDGDSLRVCKRMPFDEHYFGLGQK
jgi:alpha-glucosidase